MFLNLWKRAVYLLLCTPPDPPTFASPEAEELEFSSTLNMTLNCTATGNPPPVYTWKFPNEIQQKTEEKHKNEPVVTPSYQAEGTYVCTASNSQGKVVKTFIATQKPSKLSSVFSFLHWHCFNIMSLIDAKIPPCCCVPPGSLPGTTAAILVAVFFLSITIMACVVYRKQRHFVADRQ